MSAMKDRKQGGSGAGIHTDAKVDGHEGEVPALPGIGQWKEQKWDVIHGASAYKGEPKHQLHPLGDGNVKRKLTGHKY